MSDSNLLNSLNSDEVERYQRHINLKEVGLEGQVKIKNSSVVFVGAGGLGSSSILYLAASGIGKIGIVDDDQVSKSNLQRQVIHNTLDIGRDKIASAKKRIEQLNPNCEVKIYKKRLNTENILEIFNGFHIVCDCSDNFGTRFLINDACIILKKPLIFGSVQGFEGQVSVFNLNKQSPNLRDLIPRSPKETEIPSCEEFGVLGVSTGLIGILQANEILKIILKKGNILDGKLLIFDLFKLNMKILNLKANYKNKKIDNLSQFKDDYEKNACSESSFELKTINSFEFKKLYREQSRKIIIIDVREKNEFEKFSLKGSICIPLSSFKKKSSWEFIKSKYLHKKIFTLCQKGTRSKKASHFLRSQEIETIAVEGGIEKIGKD